MVRKAIYILIALTVLVLGILLLISYSLVPEEERPEAPAAVQSSRR